MHNDRILDDYLRRLEHAVSHLRPNRRSELVADIRAHVHDSMLDAGASDEATLRNTLDRLGSPEEVAAAAAEGQVVSATQARGRARTGDIVALIVLSLGGFLLPFVGWLAGVVLVIASQRWTQRDKIVGLLLGPILTTPVLMLLSGDVPPLGLVRWALYVGSGFSGLVSALSLASRMGNIERAA